MKRFSPHFIAVWQGPQLETARAQMHAHATVSTGQGASSGSGVFGGEMAPPVPSANGG
jgi:hypothetical protein